MKYSELKAKFREFEEKNWPHKSLTAIIVFTEDSFDKPYPRISRSYCLSSDNKAFWPRAAGYSIFSDCLDGTDPGVRLEWYMAEEGNKDGWKVEDCYILEHMRDVASIPHLCKCQQEDGSFCYFFGDTTIWAEEIVEGETVHLKPVKGDQVVCGEWTDGMDIDQVAGYCILLERYFNGKGV